MQDIAPSNNPIRILHVVTYMGRGGIETMIMNYYRHIDRSKVQFDFLVHRDFRADYDDEIEALGGKIYRLPRMIPWNLRYKTELDNFFIEHREYKIIHSHLNCMSAVILKAAMKHGIPVRIAHSHCSAADKIVKLYFRRKLIKYATQLFACGKAAGDWMFRGNTYHILNNAIDTNQYVFNCSICEDMRRLLGIPEKAYVIGHVGRFAPEKNHSFLLDVFAEVKRRKQAAFLLLVGDGELRAEMERKSQMLGIQDAVIFTGVRSDVSALMQVMDCFVLPSLFEGLPLAMVEAQAAGLPCLVSDGVSPEVALTESVQRILLSEGAEKWAEIILNLGSGQRRDLSADVVRAGYDIQSNAQYLQSYYLKHWKG